MYELKGNCTGRLWSVTPKEPGSWKCLHYTLLVSEQETSGKSIYMDRHIG